MEGSRIAPCAFLSVPHSKLYEESRLCPHEHSRGVARAIQEQKKGASPGSEGAKCSAPVYVGSARADRRYNDRRSPLFLLRLLFSGKRRSLYLIAFWQLIGMRNRSRGRDDLSDEHVVSISL
jgi:hypothetical protein